MEDVITAHGLSCMIYADDSQPHVILDPKKNRDAMLSKIELCIKDILIWCAKNGLTCDPDKTRREGENNCLPGFYMISFSALFTPILKVYSNSQSEFNFCNIYITL